MGPSDETTPLCAEQCFRLCLSSDVRGLGSEGLRVKTIKILGYAMMRLRRCLGGWGGRGPPRAANGGQTGKDPDLPPPRGGPVGMPRQESY